MEVIYFFCESAAIRVPFSYFNKRLFDLLSAHGGLLNFEKNEFIFERDTDLGRIALGFSGFICVWVEENSTVMLSGFFEKPKEDAMVAVSAKHKIAEEAGLLQTSISPPKKTIPVNETCFSTLGPPPLPEKFPEHWRLVLETELRSRKYSPKTIQCYTYYNRLICRLLQKAPEDIQSEEITQFLASVEKDREFSASSLNLAISAIKFFHREVLKREEIGDQHRPRHDKKLPMVLSKTEISEMLRRENNPKHRLLLMLVYSSGLRVSEVVSLRKEHIDLSRKVIYVMHGKGRKDRCTLLSEKAANFIKEYFDFFNIKTWLFPGQPATRPLSIRSAQQIFDKAVRRVNIQKKISIHGLRHTFATHLLESGTDIRYIQTLLGHATLRTTERYTHIARRNVLSIQSPLDTIT